MKPTAAQRRLLEDLKTRGPDQYSNIATHPTLRAGRVAVAEACRKRGWTTEVKLHHFMREVAITDEGRKALEGN